MHSFFELIKKRVSLRSYDKHRMVQEVDLKMILEAGRLAPSAQNRQPWEFWVIESPNILERVKKSYVRSWFDDVPLVLAVVGNKNEVWQRKYDGYNSLETDLSIAMDHMILAASALGIGSCWIANFEPEVLRGALQLKEDQEIFAITPLGYPKEGGSEEVKEKTRKKLGDIMRMI